MRSPLHILFAIRHMLNFYTAGCHEIFESIFPPSKYKNNVLQCISVNLYVYNNQVTPPNTELTWALYLCQNFKDPGHLSPFIVSHGPAMARGRMVSQPRRIEANVQVAGRPLSKPFYWLKKGTRVPIVRHHWGGVQVAVQIDGPMAHYFGFYFMVRNWVIQSIFSRNPKI